MNVLIIGSGSIGLSLASFLVGTHQVQILSRHASALAGGYKRTGIFGEKVISTNDFKICTSLDEIDELVDVICVCTKTYENLLLVKQLKRWRGPRAEQFKKKGIMFIFQNGFGNREVFAQWFATEKEIRPNDYSQIYLTRVITGCELIRHTNLLEVNIRVHADDLLIEEKNICDPRVFHLAVSLSESGWPTRTEKKILPYVWAKLIYNSILNPLGAILGVTYGALGESRETREIMNRLATEAFETLKASDEDLHWQTAEGFLADFYGKMLPPTAGHFSSMLQSLRNGKRTEIASTNGVIVKMAAALGRFVPTHEMMVKEIYALEKYQSILSNREIVQNEE